MGDPLARLVLLVVDEDRSAVVVDNGALPVFERPLRADEGALAPAWTDWREFGLDGPLLDTVLDPERHHGGDEPYSSLVVLGPPQTAAVPPWCHDGWHGQVEGWIIDRLRASGRAAPTEIVQTKLWAISTVLRVEAPDGRSWCKVSSDSWVSQFGIDAFEPDLRRLELVGQAYLLDSYVGIVSAIEPIRRRECSGGIKPPFNRLVELSTVDSAGGS